MENAGYLDHAFDEFVYGFSAVACFAAGSVATFSFALVAFAWRMQFETGFDILELCPLGFAFNDCLCKFIDTLVAYFLEVFASEFFVAC